uniref:Uncharacterized protein n=1 Tax=Anguilla anguilla TaxID=7936 RepID=A0A0E9WUB3_ANGAN
MWGILFLMPFFETWSHPCIIAGTILVRSVSLPLYSVQLHVMHSMWVKLVCPEMFYTLSIWRLKSSSQ